MIGGTRSYEMGRRLVAYGHQVHMITSYRKEDYNRHRKWFQTDEDGIQVHWLPVLYSNKMNYKERIAAFLKFAWKAAVKAASINCDIIFATSTPLTIALPAVYASKKQKVPMVFEVRDLWPELPIAIGAIKNPLLVKCAKLLEQFAYNNSNYVITLSPGMKNGIMKTGYPEYKLGVIPNCCDLDLFDISLEFGISLRQKFDWLKDRPLVLYAGTIGKINGVEYLARLAREVWKLDSEVRFLVIGDGKEKEKLTNEAKNCGVLNKNFFMLPEVTKKEMAKWLSAATISTSLFVVLEEMWSNSANKFFDALAAGRPVAINYAGWQAELIIKTGSGIILDPNDINDAANVLVEKIRDFEWLANARKAAKQLAVNCFSRDKMGKKLEEILIEVVSK